ncbi:hypothetical protein B1H58_15380 [Pantoea alhagi]|uniref:Uncharacterized protein n=1 Tax=Pantoea alhagi TaxID=1891675 RepID=A0A1W6B848_9GAMM|nr:hypothetical protein [Pantoea alhagi]ARJ43278.1 hypothetical protein B1H58_15380 [Pantoea alhagi]
MNNDELERAEFEALMRALGFNDFFMDWGNYQNFTVQTSWRVWCVARSKQEQSDGDKALPAS